jgi:hypothetical protein
MDVKVEKIYTGGLTGIETIYRQERMEARMEIFIIHYTDLARFVQFEGITPAYENRWITQDFEDAINEHYDAFNKASEERSWQKAQDAADKVDGYVDKFDAYGCKETVLVMNALDIMRLSRKFLCKEYINNTDESGQRYLKKMWQKTLDKIAEQDPALVKYCKPMCEYRGGKCPYTGEAYMGDWYKTCMG